MKKPKVILTKKVIHKMSFFISATKNRFEIGGLLIGYRMHNIFFVIDITSPQKSDLKSMVSFTLNGKKHMQMALIIAERFLIPPTIIGNWHTHICDFSLSKQDIVSNKILAKHLDGALSILILPSKRLLGYYFPKGKSYLPVTLSFNKKRNRGVL